MTRTTTLALLLAVLGTAASAHSKSEATIPADGATVAEVAELTLRFDDPMRIVSVALTSDGDEVRLERETGMEPATEFRAAPVEPLAPGSYRLDWRGMAADGHPMQGGFEFTVSE
ncbi:Copper resistance protein C precursor [Roseivivax jejudonensis]|uniref:Copper resistance protein C n=1 Tax=Roseivivax jejudonensis TaxID=1529041 RepID=A0A1X6ZCL4_9RHOB|nr:copper resistance CopC family protein [Roseivivax jejudonensis]SLN45810.1 Copper resistance protein C precursor [Roseivivax jejudonensis]